MNARIYRSDSWRKRPRIHRCWQNPDVELKHRRRSLDRLRMDYRRRVTTADGSQIVVRARRKIDVESVDPLEVPVPLLIQAIWVALREQRNHDDYEHLWVVDVLRRYGFEKARRLAELPKYEALDLVDAHAAELVSDRNEVR